MHFWVVGHGNVSLNVSGVPDGAYKLADKNAKSILSCPEATFFATLVDMHGVHRIVGAGNCFFHQLKNLPGGYSSLKHHMEAEPFNCKSDSIIACGMYVAVSDSHQGKGIATGLTNAAEWWLGSHGIKNMTGAFNENNQAGVAALEKRCPLRVIRWERDGKEWFFAMRL